MRRWQGDRWKFHETAFLKRHFGKQTVAWIATQLGRSVDAVKGALRRQGISVQQDSRAAWEPILRACHASGGLDRDIAKAMGVPANTAVSRRRNLGLPANRKLHPKAKSKVQAKLLKNIRRRLRSDGAQSLNCYRETQGRIAAALRGWMQAWNDSEANVLDAIESQPMTRKDIAKLLGIRQQQVNGPAARLLKRGIILSVPRRNESVATRGRPASELRLAPSIHRRLFALHCGHNQPRSTTAAEALASDIEESGRQAG